MSGISRLVKGLVSVSSLLLVANAVVADNNQCKGHFGLELEFAYVGEPEESFFDDAPENHVPPLNYILNDVATIVSEFNGWPILANQTQHFKKTVSGADYPKLSVSWRDASGRNWVVSQESVGGRLYDGLEVITPKLSSTAEAAYLVDRLYAMKELAKGPFSGLHIWVDTSCLVNPENSVALAQLLVDYEDMWSPLLKKHFQLSEKQQALRGRFWKSYSSCNPRLLQSLRALLASDASAISLKELRELFVKYTEEELACARLKSIPNAATRAARRFWRYKELNIASPLNLAENDRNAVEFRAWDFMDGKTLEKAIRTALDIVQATATPSEKAKVVKVLELPAAPSPVSQSWAEVNVDEMLFHRNLQDPKIDPKIDAPTSSPTATLNCSDITTVVEDKADRERLCLASESCDYDSVANACYEITTCDDYNQFKSAQKERKTRCEGSRLVSCTFNARQCSIPFPTVSPTTPNPTQSPVVSTCEMNNDPTFASRAVRRAGCTEEKGCVWSGGECYAISSCANFNLFEMPGRKRECLASAELNCVFDSSAKECVENEIPTGNLSSCGDVNEYSFVDVDVREDACVAFGECVWSSATKAGECFKVNSCEDINQFATRNQGRKTLCLENSDFSCTFSGATKDCTTRFVPTSTTTCADISGAPVSKAERKSLCSANDDCEWSNKQKTCFQIDSCDDYNQFEPANYRRKKCKNSERFSCQFSEGVCGNMTRLLRHNRNLQSMETPTASPITLELTPEIPSEPTVSPTMSPTSSPVVSTCEHNNDKKFGSREQRQAGCSKEKGCVWSDVTKHGECYEVKECEDFNLFKNKDSARKLMCTESEDFTCEFKNGKCGLPSPTASPTTAAPTMSPIESTCQDNNKANFASKAIRRLGCTQEKGCFWSDATGKGECYSVSGCSDFDQFKNKDGARRKLCEMDSDFDCLFVSGKCRDAVSPTAVACLTLNKPSTGTKAERKALCMDEGCVWSSAGTGECFVVESCDDYNQFSNVNGKRRSMCLKDPFNCMFKAGQCSTPSPTTSPTTSAPTSSPVETSCEDNGIVGSAPKAVRKAGCTAEKGCVWSSAAGGECHTVEDCSDFNKFAKGNGKRRALCLNSDLNCAFSGGECFVLAPTTAPTMSPVAQ